MHKKNGQAGFDLVGRRITHQAPGGKQTGRVTLHEGARIEFRPDGATEGTTVIAHIDECVVLPESGTASTMTWAEPLAA